MKIISDDIVRIIEKLQENLSFINSIKEKVSIDDWMFTRKSSKEEWEKKVSGALDEIDYFPLSIKQVQNNSRREETKKYLRLQHGNNII